MNTSIVKNRTLLLLSLLLLVCGVAPLQAETLETKRKELKRSYSVSANDKIKLDNRYGNITVTHWNRDEVEINVEIEAKARNTKRAEELIERISVNFDKSSNVVSATTRLKNAQGGKNESFEIRYHVTMPATMEAEIKMEFGNVKLPENNPGRCDLKLQYGNLNAGDFDNEVNIAVAFGDMAIGNTGDLTLKLEYSGSAKVGDVKNLKLNNQFSTLTMKNAASINGPVEYGNLTVERLGSATINLQFSKATIKELTGELYLKRQEYSDVKIHHVAPSFSKITSNADFSTMELGLDNGLSCEIYATEMEFGSVDVKNGDGLQAESTKKKHDYHIKINRGGNKEIRFDGNGFSNLKVKTASR